MSQLLNVSWKETGFLLTSCRTANDHANDLYIHLFYHLNLFDCSRCGERGLFAVRSRSAADSAPCQVRSVYEAAFQLTDEMDVSTEKST